MADHRKSLAAVADQIDQANADERYLRALDAVVAVFLAERDDFQRETANGPDVEDGPTEHARLLGHLEARQALARRLADAFTQEGLTSG